MLTIKSRIHFIANLFERIAGNAHFGLKKDNWLWI